MRWRVSGQNDMQIFITGALPVVCYCLLFFLKDLIDINFLAPVWKFFFFYLLPLKKGKNCYGLATKQNVKKFCFFSFPGKLCFIRVNEMLF